MNLGGYLTRVARELALSSDAGGALRRTWRTAPTSCPTYSGRSPKSAPALRVACAAGVERIPSRNQSESALRPIAHVQRDEYCRVLVRVYGLISPTAAAK